MKQDILKYLEEDKRFRERALKNKGIANLMMKKYHIEIPKDKRDDFISDILSSDRFWRMILEERSDLRGSDYEDKEKLELQKQSELGYQVKNSLEFFDKL